MPYSTNVHGWGMARSRLNNLYMLEATTYLHIKEPRTARIKTQLHHYNTRQSSDYYLPVQWKIHREDSYIGCGKPPGLSLFVGFIFV